ncbi:hypothetical protein BJ741DRAFT_587163 [Chytriomyces cf. hyalinus JEL632]|nr:hypothetical protein BJ741DRAFT_587163 [Chytriomyces cf. hyalinus JEL632]
MTSENTNLQKLRPSQKEGMESIIATTRTSPDLVLVRDVYSTLHQQGAVLNATTLYTTYLEKLDASACPAGQSGSSGHEIPVIHLLYFLSLGSELYPFAPALLKLCSFIDQLDPDAKDKLGMTLVLSLEAIDAKTERQAVFQKIVALVHSFIMIRIANVDSPVPLTLLCDDGIMAAVTFLELLNDINNENDYVSFEEFYNDAIKEAISMKEDYPRWKSSSGFSFFNYPFLLDSHAKGDILKIENMITMRHELQDSFFRAMFIGVNSPYLHLEVRRDHVVRDSVAQLTSKTAHDLKKQLRVSFVGEEGIDDGGIQKEFFQMVVKEIFNPNHGMFQYDTESRLCWFSKEYITDPGVIEEYHLLGRLLGLAIYNSNTLEIPFPTALFKKLLHTPVTLEDLLELDPALGRGLQNLLAYDNADFQELYDWTFQIQYDGPTGTRQTHDLKTHGASIQLTRENRSEFVQLYVDFIFNKAVATAFQSFSDGVYSVVDRDSLVFFRAEEFQQLVVGCPDLDFKALEENAKYDGWEDGSVIVNQFWEIVHAMDLEDQKKLLFFTTGSDRAPVGGLGNLSFVIARNGPDCDRLPTSHTCYNILLLNEYASKEKLEERLRKAISFAHCGFFLL